jgi:hypothetical protein
MRALLDNAVGELSRALLGYNHSDTYVAEVLARTPAGPTTSSSSPASRHQYRRCARPTRWAPLPVPPTCAPLAVLRFPRAYRALPSWALASSGSSVLIDARLYDDVTWIVRHYRLRVTAAREAGHCTHGDGTAIDVVPAAGLGQDSWDTSAGALARDLGWSPTCARSGTRPSCPLVPAIQFVGYDGYPGHGSPRTCTGRCPAHLHISWASPCFGTSERSLPREAVMAFVTPQRRKVKTVARIARERSGAGSAAERGRR